MAIELSDLLIAPTADDVKASIYTALARLGVRTSAWEPGGVVRSIISVVSVVLADGFGMMTTVARAGFLEYSSGNWLTMVARYNYGVERRSAAFAAGELTLVNSGGGVFDLAIGELTALAPSLASGAKTYTNTTPVSLTALGTTTVDIIATEAGSPSSAEAGDINTLVTTLSGVACANAAALLGADEESDYDLRLRCYEKQASLSPNGAHEAYAYVARSAASSDGTPVGVTRVRVLPPAGDGALTIVVATATGGLTSGELATVTTAVLGQATPIGVSPTVISATEINLDVTCEVWIYDYANLTGDALTTLIESGLVTFFASQPIGGNAATQQATGYVSLYAILSQIYATDPAIYKVTLAEPTQDVSLTSAQIIKLDALTVTAIHITAARGE